MLDAAGQAAFAFHIKNMATMVVTARPIVTGRRFRRASSKGSTLQIAAAGIRAHGTRVPPPTQMAEICPRAVKVAAPESIAVANKLAMEPVSEIPEKPDPSRPVIAPTTVKVTAATSLLNGTTEASATPRSFTIPFDAFGRNSPIMVVKPESPK